MDASQSSLSTGSLGGPTTTNSGNPTYSDASAGPGTSEVPNAKPYGLPKKKKPEDDNYDKTECVMIELFLQLNSEAGTQVQSFIFDKDHYSKDQAQAWLKKHDKNTGIDTTTDSHRARQKDPSSYDPKSFRTIPITTGIKAVIGKPKAEDMRTTIPKMKYCQGCNKGHEDKVTVCDKCSSTEFSDSPTSKYTISG